MAEFAEAGAQPQHRHGMNLRNPRFAHPQHRAHFLHSEFFVIVERQHLAFFFRQLGNSFGQQFFHLRAQAKKQRSLLGIIWKELAEILLAPIARRFHAQAADFEAIDFPEQELQGAQLHAQLSRQLGFRGISPQLRAQLIVSFLHAPCFAPEIARIQDVLQAGAHPTVIAPRIRNLA